MVSWLKKQLISLRRVALFAIGATAGILATKDWTGYWAWFFVAGFLAMALLFDYLLFLWYVRREQYEAREELKTVSMAHLGDELEKAFEDSAPRMGVDFYARMRKVAMEVIKREM